MLKGKSKMLRILEAKQRQPSTTLRQVSDCLLPGYMMQGLERRERRERGEEITNSPHSSLLPPL